LSNGSRIVIGGSYQTRDGRKAVITKIDYSDQSYPVRGTIEGDLQAATWTQQGKWNRSLAEDGRDLVYALGSAPAAKKLDQSRKPGFTCKHPDQSGSGCPLPSEVGYMPCAACPYGWEKS